MRLTQMKTQGTGRRVQGFLDAQAAIVGTAVPPSVRAQLDAAVAQLTTYSVEQETTDGSAQSHTALQEEYRKDLYVRFVRPIARITKRVLVSISADERMALVMTADDTRLPSVVTKVTALADAAEKYQPVFVDNGMPSDFIAQVRAAIAQLTTSIDTRDRHVARRGGATAALAAADRNFKELLAQIDSVLLPVLRGNPAVLAEWTAAKHIPRVATTPLPNGSITMPDASSSVAPVTPVTPLPTPANPAA